MGTFTQKCGFPCIKSEKREIACGMERADQSERKGEGEREKEKEETSESLNMTGVRVCSCGRVDMIPDSLMTN